MTSENPYESPAGGAAKSFRNRSRIVGAIVGVAVWLAVQAAVWLIAQFGTRKLPDLALYTLDALVVATHPLPVLGNRFFRRSNGPPVPWLDDMWLSVIVSVALWGSAGAWLWGRRRG